MIHSTIPSHGIAKSTCIILATATCFVNKHKLCSHGGTLSEFQPCTGIVAVWLHCMLQRFVSKSMLVNNFIHSMCRWRNILSTYILNSMTKLTYIGTDSDSIIKPIIKLIEKLIKMITGKCPENCPLGCWFC